jgi:cell division septal protein FtsQ
MRLGKRLLGFFFRIALLTLSLAGGLLIGHACWLFHEFLFESPYFAIREITIQFDDEPGFEDDLRVEMQIRHRLRSEGISGGNILKLDGARARQIVEEHPKVGTASVRKVLPDRVMVQVRRRVPVALALGAEIYVIDIEGAVLETLEIQNPRVLEFPFITGVESGRLEPGAHIQSENLTKILGLILCLKERARVLYEQISEAHCDKEGNLTLILKGGSEIRFGSGDPIGKMPALDTFIEKMGDPSGYVYIDLRLDDQIPALPKENVPATPAP